MLVAPILQIVSFIDFFPFDAAVIILHGLTPPTESISSCYIFYRGTDQMEAVRIS